jgi:hypothetical protein
VQCTACVQQAATERANERVEAKRLEKEIATLMLEQHRNARVAQQQEGERVA